MPVARSSVSINAVALPPPEPPPSTRSTSSYSRRPSWTTVRPPLDTNRRDGNVGVPTSSARPSATSPRSTTVKAHSACDVVGRFGQREAHPQAVVSRRVDEARAHPDRRLVGPDLERGLDGHLVAPDPRSGRLVDPIGPGEGGGDGDGGPDRPTVAHRDPDRVGHVHHGVDRRRRVVVGVAVVTTVDELSEPRDAVDRERARVGVDGHRDQTVSDDRARGRLVDPHRMDEWGGGEPGPAEPGHGGLAGQDAAGRRLVEGDPDLGVRPGGEQGEELALDLFDADSGPRVGADDDGDVHAGVVLGHGDVGDVGVVVDARTLDQPEHAANGGAVEGDRPGQTGAFGQHLDVGAGLTCRHLHHLDHPTPLHRARIDHHRTRAGHGGGQRGQGLVGQSLADVPGLGIPVQHRVHHVVDRARADRVVGRVADHLRPGHPQEGLRPGVGRQEQGGKRFGHPLESPFCPGCRLFDVDAVGAHSHQQVRACPRAQLTVPVGQPVVGRTFEVGGQRGDGQLEFGLDLVGLGHDTSQPGLGGLVIGAVHQQQRITRSEKRGELLGKGAEAANQRLGVLGQGGSVPVSGHQVLGPHVRAVGRMPAERGPVDLGGNPTPHDGVFESGQREDLGHLGDVTEHVGQVADLHHAAELAAARGSPSAGSGRWSPRRRGTRPSGCTRARRRSGPRLPVPAAGGGARGGSRGSRRPPPTARRAGSACTSCPVPSGPAGCR